MNDTQRLDWVLSRHVEFDWVAVDNSIPRKIKHWYVSWYEEGVRWSATGKDKRECIDNALIGNAEKV